jgi:glycyl-tRNA synthetase
MNTENLMEKIVSLCKRRGFVFQGSEIYGGLAGTYDYGPLGSLLKNNLRDSWLRTFVHRRMDMYLVDAAILMNQRVWQATGHVDEFIDPLVECSHCQKRCRVDHLVDEKAIEPLVIKYCVDMDDEDVSQARRFVGPLMQRILQSEGVRCPECSKVAWGIPRVFNMMLQTRVGAASDSSAISYLRPETAQGIFVNYKNVVDSQSPKLPFGIAQVGKAFRNEITPRDFIFRLRELEQMEIEYFINPHLTRHPEEPRDPEGEPHTWQEYFEYWIEEQREWLEAVGIDGAKLHQYEHPVEGRAHYSGRTVDWEFEFPFGTKELTGLAYRTDFDLSRHAESSGQKLDYFDEESKTRLVPHVIEPTFGLDRLVLAVLSSAYCEEVLENGEVRVYLKLAPAIAPYKVCVSPLLRNKPELVERARAVFQQLRDEFMHVVWDDSGNIGKRYRRQDEIGTPMCIVIDFDSLDNDDVTIRDRDTGEQVRVPMSELSVHIRARLLS